MAVCGLYRTFVTSIPSRGYWHTLVILLHGRPKLDCMAAWMYFSSFRKPHHVRCGVIELQFWWLDPTLMINKVVMLLRVDTRPRCHPRAMHEITNLLRVFVAQLAKLLLEFCWQKFLLHPGTQTEISFRVPQRWNAETLPLSYLGTLRFEGAKQSLNKKFRFW